MQRIHALHPDTVPGKTKELFNTVREKLGMIPNMMQTMGNSPAVLSVNHESLVIVRFVFRNSG